MDAGQRRTLVEVVGAFVVASVVASVLYRVRSLPVIGGNIHVLVALTFIGLPLYLLRNRGGIERYGYHAEPIAAGLKLYALATIVILPLYGVGFWLAQRGLCHFGFYRAVVCENVAHPELRLPADLPLFAISQLVVVALPEELFFRGYMQGRLEEVWLPTHPFLGVKVGRAWLLTAILFAVGHVAVTFHPAMFTRFFPGLVFGVMFLRTRSLLASTLFHATCNVYADILARSVFG